MTKKRKKAIFNWSGGKDSALALYKALQSDEYDIISLLTTVNSDTKRSTMHAIPHAILQEQADCIGLPLHTVDLVADGSMSDYSEAMEKVTKYFKAKGVNHFIFGDIYLHDVRSYRERQLTPLGIEVVEPLWDRTSEEVMDDFLASGLKTMIVTTMADKLGKEYIGKVIDQDLADALPKDIDICGENGEYHTLCYDGPLFGRPLAFELGEPFFYSHEVKMDDGSTEEFSYWFANIVE